MNTAIANGVLSAMLTLGVGASEQAPNTSLQQPEPSSAAQVTIYSENFLGIELEVDPNQQLLPSTPEYVNAMTILGVKATNTLIQQIQENGEQLPTYLQGDDLELATRGVSTFLALLHASDRNITDESKVITLAKIEKEINDLLLNAGLIDFYARVGVNLYNSGIKASSDYLEQLEKTKENGCYLGEARPVNDLVYGVGIDSLSREIALSYFSKEPTLYELRAFYYAFLVSIDNNHLDPDSFFDIANAFLGTTVYGNPNDPTKLGGTIEVPPDYTNKVKVKMDSKVLRQRLESLGLTLDQQTPHVSQDHDTICPPVEKPYDPNTQSKARTNSP